MRAELPHIEPIRDERMHQHYLGQIEILAQLDPPPESELGARLQALAQVVEAYEKLHFPI